MHLNKVFGLICFVISSASTSPAPFAGDGSSDFFLDDPSNKSVVKRRIFEDNTDRQLNQISLSSLVSDVENNIFASTLSLNEALMNKNVSVSEIKVKDDVNNDHQSTIKQENITTIATKESSANLPVSDKVILQNIEKVPLTNGEPAHIVINRIAIQPHTGGLAPLPIFELKHTGEKKRADKDPEITKITVSKTAITSLDTANPYSSTIPLASNGYTLNSTTAPTTITTTEADLKSVTTPKNIEQLKEAEEELKEKFAEIEAEPIILSARV